MHKTIFIPLFRKKKGGDCKIKRNTLQSELNIKFVSFKVSVGSQVSWIFAYCFKMAAMQNTFKNTVTLLLGT